MKRFQIALLLIIAIAFTSCEFSSSYIETTVEEARGYNKVRVKTYIWRYGKIMASYISEGDDFQGVHIYDLPAELKKHEVWARNTTEVIRLSDSVENRIENISPQN